MSNPLVGHVFSSMRLEDRIDLGDLRTRVSSVVQSRHAESASLIADGISEYDVPSLEFLRLTERERRNVLRSYQNNLILQEKILTTEDILPRKRYCSTFVSPLFEEFPDGGLFKSALYANFKLRASYPDSPYAAQIGQAYLEYAFFAYGVYFETKTTRVLSLRSLEDLLDAFDKYGIDFTDDIKLYQLQTFIEKTAKGESPFYTSARSEFEAKYGYSEDNFRCIPSERIFPMMEADPEDWKAALLPLSYSKTESERFRLVAREFIESRGELDSLVSERELYRFQNVSCASEEDPSKSAKLRKEVRSGYEMDSKPFQFKRTLIKVSTSNYRDAWVNTPSGRAKLRYFEILARRMIRNVPEIPDGDMEMDGYVEHLRFSPGYTYVMGDLKKWGITFPVYLIRIFCEEAEKRFPFGWTQMVQQLEEATLWVDGEPIKVGTRGFGLGNLNYISSIIHYLIIKLTNVDKFVVRSDDSLTRFAPTENPYYEIYLKEKLGFIVNRKKVNISSKANVFCENYAEIESKFQTQLYEKLGYMMSQLGAIMKKVCNSASAKYHIACGSELELPSKSLIDFLISLCYALFGYEFDQNEIKLDFHCGGWAHKYYQTNLKSDYIAFEEDLEAHPENSVLIRALYKNKLHPQAPSTGVKTEARFCKLLQDKVFPDSKLEKDLVESELNTLIPITTPFEFVEELNDQLQTTQRLNKNAHLRTRKWRQLERRRKSTFSKLDLFQYYTESDKEILLERIEENFLQGKSGYAMPSLIFEEEEFLPRDVFCFDKSIGVDSSLVRLPFKPTTLEEEDRQLTSFLKEIRKKRLPVNIPRFDLWKESKSILYSTNELQGAILCADGHKDVIKKNEKYLSYFNIPTEITYLDWCTRMGTRGYSEVYRSDFSFRTPDKKSLYDPNLFKRECPFSGEDPRRLQLFGCIFYIHKDDFEIVRSGLKLMKYLPEYEEELGNLFNILYTEGVVSPDFKMKRDELISDLEIKKHQKGIAPEDQEAEEELALEMIEWRSEMAKEGQDDSFAEFQQEAPDLAGLLNLSSQFERQETEEIDEDRILDMFEDGELDASEKEESEADDDFEFDYDYSDSE